MDVISGWGRYPRFPATSLKVIQIHILLGEMDDLMAILQLIRI
jgi:hypothetical protein